MKPWTWWLVPLGVVVITMALGIPCATLSNAVLTAWAALGMGTFVHHFGTGCLVDSPSAWLRSFKLLHHVLGIIATAPVLASTWEEDAVAPDAVPRPFLQFVVVVNFWLWVLYVCVDPFTHDGHHGDDRTYALHHAVTLVLLAVASVSNRTLAAATVLFCMDVSDVFLSCLKTTRNRLNTPRPLLHLLYGLFVGTWIVFRLVVYPMRIMVPALQHVARNTYDSRAFTVGAVATVVLQCLNIMWTVDVVQAVRKHAAR